MTQLTVSSDRTTDRPVPDRRWLRWGAVVLAADLVIHNALGVLMNDWEGWGVFWVNVVFVLVTGVVIVGLTYCLVVRSALRRNHAAGAALGTGIASLACYAIVFTWAPVLIAPAALLLAGTALRSAPSPTARWLAIAGAAFAIATLGVAVWFEATAILTDAFPNLPFLGPLNPAL